jgi:hypothetical protein
MLSFMFGSNEVWLANAMQPKLSRQVGSRANTVEFPNISWNTKVEYGGHKSQALDTCREKCESNICNSILILNIHFNIGVGDAVAWLVEALL